MKITEYAASRAARAVDILITEEVGATLQRGDVMVVTERSGLEVKRIASVRLGDVPQALLLQYVEPVGNKKNWRPHYCETTFNSLYCAALAQIRHDADEAFSMDDVTGADVLDTRVSMVRVQQVANYGG